MKCRPDRMVRVALLSVMLMGGARLAQAEVKLTAGDGDANDFLGRNVAVSGDTIVVGAQQDDDLGTNSGAAYVWVKSGNSWVETQKLTAPDGAAFDSFGYRVAVSNDTIVVGAPFHNSGANADGAAYVFEPDGGGGWAFAAKLTASDGAFLSELGWSVAIDGDVVVVGARWDNEVALNAGAAYIFERPVGGWVDTFETAKLTATDGAPGDQFGLRVAVSVDTVVVGAPLDDDACALVDPDCNTGSVYVFHDNGAAWTEVAKLTSPDPVGGDFFGRALAIQDGTVVVGAPFHLHGGFYSGAAYVYVEPGAGGVDTSVADAELISSDPTASASADGFGYSVAVSGRTVVVGASGDDDACAANNNCNSGSLYTYTEPGPGWNPVETETDKITASDMELGDNFGVSAALDGNTLVVGASYEDEQGSNAGAAYVYLLTPAGGVPGPPPNANANANKKK